MTNKEIAAVFHEMADILDIKGDIPFRINAYRVGAIAVENYAKDLAELFRKDSENFPVIPGIGEGLHKKIIEIIKTGKCAEHKKLLKGFPKGLLEMLKLRGVGPKKVKLFNKKLGITTVKQLEAAATRGKLRDLQGMGEKSEADILKAISESKTFKHERFPIDLAYNEALELIKYLKECGEISKAEFAGSLRRFQETIGDIDILATVKKTNASDKIVMDHFVDYNKIYSVLSKGETKSSVILMSGIQVDLRVVENGSFGAALHYFTGNKQHNIRIRDIAKRRGLKINEYGVFKNEKKIGGKTEKEIFNATGIAFVPPELRRNEGEFEYAFTHKKFPRLVELDDIKGDLHIHSDYSDGKFSIEEMALACLDLGYKYLGIADHGKLLASIGGMSEQKIKQQWKEIDKLNKKYSNKIKILKSAEVDILKDGSLDFSDEILKELDYAIISIHHRYKSMTSKERTKRIITAIENPYAKILAHPTGRLINQRDEMDVDIEEIINACVANNVVLEINSNPQRLDLYEKHIMIAKDKKAGFAINTDAHHIEQLHYMRFGVGMARRGWCEKKHIVNALALPKFDN